MNRSLFTLAVGLGLSVFSSAHADLKTSLYQKLLERETEARRGIIRVANVASFAQAIDHFAKPNDPLSGKTFKQRYWVDSQFASGLNAPVIYEICGESTCAGTSATGPIFLQAKRLRAHLVALEHRYYGTSQPFKDLSAQSLKQLSTLQAIEDLASFQRFAQTKLGLKGKWVTVGGSYAGSVSAFYRLKHPELAVAALASSGPVKAKADFFEYDEHVAKVAGPECLRNIKDAVAEVERRMALGDSEVAKVKKLFLADKVRDNRDFLYVLADMASIAIQYGRQKDFCDALDGSSGIDDLLANYSKVGTEMLTWFGIDAVQDSFQGAESLDPADYVESFGARAWLYQTCTEYGYWQIASANDATSARSAKITRPYHDEVCNRLFGLTKPVDTAATNKLFYDHLFDASVSKIHFTNGTNDPWSNLSILSGSAEAKRNPALTFLSLLGFAHCDDLGKVIPEAQAKLTSLLDQWLK